jgi:septum site-determining protein MinD
MTLVVSSQILRLRSNSLMTRMLHQPVKEIVTRNGHFFSSSFSTSSQHSFVLSHPSLVDSTTTTTTNTTATAESSKRRGRIICITSGKGGVGKTTVSASISMGLAQRGHRVCVVDLDIGLRNLDLHLGCERRVIFDFVHVLLGECSLHQALLRDKREPNLSLLAASQTRDKDCLTLDGVERILADLTQTFDFVVLDSPAGIESGAKHSMYFADDAILVVNPELSSCRDADKMVGFIASKSRRAELGERECLPVQQSLLINRYDPTRAAAEESLAIADIEELLGLPVIGVIPGK